MPLPHRLLLATLLAITLSACDRDSGETRVDNATSVDLLVINANGYTLADGELHRFETLAIHDGKVVASGDATLVGDFDASRVLDAGGKTVLPGLIDAHGHIANLGELRSTLDLAGIGSLDTTIARIRAYEENMADGTQWLIGRGWNQVLWTEQRFPTAADLDDIIADRPVFLRRVDSHAAWVNTAALRLAGIDADTPDPAGGKIIRDEAGNATGVLVDMAISLVSDAIPPTSEDQQREYLRVAMYELASLGITGVHDAGVSPSGTTMTDIRLYQQLADGGDMPIRVSAMLGAEALARIDGPIIGYADDLFEATSVKLYADGALGSRGAAMIEPYSDDPGNSGLLFASENELAKQIAAAHAKGFAANVHAIGDRANATVLNAFANVNGGKPTPFNDRIEHAQIVTLDDIERFAARRMLEAGVRVAAGSDFPVEKPAVFDGLYAAVTRKDKDGQPPDGWFPDQALTREEALAAFTVWAADSVGQADRIGSLTPGKWADFVVIDRDYFTIPASEIWQIKVEQTWVGGRQIAAR